MTNFAVCASSVTSCSLQKNLRRRETIAELLLQQGHLRVHDIGNCGFRARYQEILDDRAAQRASPAGDYRDSVLKYLHLDAPLGTDDSSADAAGDIDLRCSEGHRGGFARAAFSEGKIENTERDSRAGSIINIFGLSF